MTNDENKILDNILDGLDRLFDRESKAIDLQALIFATSKALSDTEHFAILDDAANSLEKIVNSGLKADEERDAALNVTNDLRIYLAEIWNNLNLKV